MRKTTQKEHQAEENRLLRLYYLHVECVRRNPDYVKAYWEVQKTQGDAARSDAGQILKAQWNLWLLVPLPGPGDRPDLLKLKEGQFPALDRALVGFTDVDPLENRAARHLTIHVLDLNRERLNAIARELKGFVFLLYFPEEEEKDFPARWSLTTLDMRRSKTEVREALEDWASRKLARRAAHGLAQTHPPMRVHLDEGYDYLRAHDLREQRKTFLDIAKDIWPEQHKSARQAQTYWKNAEKMIRHPPLLRLSKEHVAARSKRR